MSSGSTASSPPGISIPAVCADLQPERDVRQRLRIGPLDGQVVEHRDGLGADADEVVDVHSDAVDPHRLEAIGLLGDDDLRAHAVGETAIPRLGATRRTDA